MLWLYGCSRGAVNYGIAIEWGWRTKGITVGYRYYFLFRIAFIVAPYVLGIHLSVGVKAEIDQVYRVYCLAIIGGDSTEILIMFLLCLILLAGFMFLGISVFSYRYSIMCLIVVLSFILVGL